LFFPFNTLCAERALRSGALGYRRKQASTAQIMTAIRTVLARKCYVSDKIGQRILANAFSADPNALRSPVESLTNRQLQVVELLGQGTPPARSPPA
jgi:DNA-binding NarL/FixJ family response regulator